VPNPDDYPGGSRADGLPAVLSDPGRLAALRASGQIGSLPEAVFDDLTRLAAAVTGVPLSAITFVGEDRTYWKSVTILDYQGFDAWQNAVGDSFCYFPVGTGTSFIVDDASTDPRTAGHPAIGPWGVGAWAGFPIMSADGHAIGSMCVIDAEPRKWSAQELETLAILARAVSNEVNLRVSLEAARNALAASNELAGTLQQSLLPPSLPSVPGLDTAARYLPASGDATVVGDFYDLFPVRGPWWSAVIGDVCGKGVEAAKVTALARYTLRADIGKHLSPTAALSHLNTVMISQKSPRFLTAAYLTLRATAAGAAGRIGLAGHPPALVRRADGRIDTLGAYGRLLGVYPRARLSDVRFRLAPGDLLLLYTDGACEGRAAPATADPRPMFGPEDLARTLAGTRGQDAAATLDAVAAALAARHDGWHSDDTAMLALRVPPRAE
jgi:serine phosphatase RsbU (regulator of sigma subunit)